MSKTQRAIEHATPAEIDELAGVTPWPTLDDAALIGLAGDVVRMIEPHTESDPVALLTQTICAFGNAIGGVPTIRLKRTDTTRISLSSLSAAHRKDARVHLAPKS